MRFIVDENLENFQEIHGWLVGLGSTFQEITTNFKIY